MLDFIMSVAGFILSFILGCLLITTITNSFTKSNAFIIIFAGIGTGAGLSSLLYFACLILHFPYLAGVLVEAALVLFLGFRFRKKIHQNTSSDFDFDNTEVTNPPSGIFVRILVAVFWIFIINTIAFYFVRASQNPHGGGDAYHIWNLKARFLFNSDTDHWRTIFSELLNYSHPDYPLLVPGFIAGNWTLASNDATSVSIMTHFIFAASVAGLIFASLYYFKSKLQAYLATLFIVCTPFFIISATNQFADVPLSFFFLATTIFIFIAFRERDDRNARRHFIVIGLLTSLSMWTKNEGILFFLAVPFAILVCSFYFKNTRETVRRLLYFALGAAPVLLVIFYFKVFLVPANDLIASQGANTAKNITDLSRYVIILKAFFTTAWSFGQWVMSPLLLAAFYAWMIGGEYKKPKNAIVTGTLIILLMLAGYFFTYVNTYWDITEHLASSLDRLFLQLMPSMLFLYFASLQTPENYLHQKKKYIPASESRI